MQATIDSMVTKMKRLSDSIHFVNFHHETQSKCILRFKIVTKTSHPSTVGYCRGSGRGLVFVTMLLLKCIFLVFHVENGQNEYILIIFSYTNIVSILSCIDL